MSEENSENLNNSKNNTIFEQMERHPIIIGALCITIPICFLQLIYGGLVYFDITCFSKPLSESDLLGFFGNIFGSFIGGIFAIYVLKLTLDNERDMQKREHRLSVMPMLLYSISEQKIVYDRKKSEDIFDAGIRGDKSIEMKFSIHNIGLGPAVFVKLGVWKVGNKKCVPNDCTWSIPKDEEVSIILKLELPTYDGYDEEIGQDIDFSRCITFKNLLGNVYEQEVFFRFHRLKGYVGENQIETEEISILGYSEISDV